MSTHHHHNTVVLLRCESRCVASSSLSISHLYLHLDSPAAADQTRGSSLIDQPKDQQVPLLFPVAQSTLCHLQYHFDGPVVQAIGVS